MIASNGKTQRPHRLGIDHRRELDVVGVMRSPKSSNMAERPTTTRIDLVSGFIPTRDCIPRVRWILYVQRGTVILPRVRVILPEV